MNPIVQKILLKFSNPSLGPYEKKVSYSLSRKEYSAEFDSFLSEGIVYGVYTLDQYVQAVANGDESILGKINACKQEVDRRGLNSGARIEKLILETEQNGSVTFSDLRYYAFNKKVYDFLDFIVKKGARTDESDFADFKVQ